LKLSKIFAFILFFTLIAIEFLATTPLEFKPIENSWDKANHAFAFAVLYIILSLSFQRFKIKTRIFLLLLFGVQIEVVQSFIPYRDASLLDIFADSVGIIIGVSIFKFVEFLSKQLIHKD
jgi:VanZ family protein